MFRTVPLSIIRSFFYCTHSNGICHTACKQDQGGTACEQDQDRTSSVLILLASCMTYIIAVCTVENSWWWTQEMSETCRVFYILLTVHLSIFISVYNQIDAQNLFHNKFYFITLHVSSTCAHHQEVKIVLHSVILIELHFSNFRPLTCFSVMKPEVV